MDERAADVKSWPFATSGTVDSSRLLLRETPHTLLERSRIPCPGDLPEKDPCGWPYGHDPIEASHPQKDIVQIFSHRHRRTNFRVITGVASFLQEEERSCFLKWCSENALTPRSSTGDPEATRDEVIKMKDMKDWLSSHKKELDEDQIRFLRDDSTLLRYLRAREGNVQKALNMIEYTLKWRRKTQPHLLYCEQCLRDPFCADIRVIGFDERRRPVLYSSFKQSPNRTCERTVLHTICVMEKATQLLTNEGDEKIVWITNFNGFSFKDLNPRFGLETTSLFSNHYPERLHAFVLINAPKIFNGLFRLVKPTLSKATASKVTFVELRGKEREKGELQLITLLGNDLGSWLVHRIELDNGTGSR